jgi:hypothetical protein
METQTLNKEIAENLDVESSEVTDAKPAEKHKDFICRKRAKAEKKPETDPAPSNENPEEEVSVFVDEDIDLQWQDEIDFKRTDYQVVLIVAFFFLAPPIVFFGIVSLASPGDQVSSWIFIGCSAAMLLISSYIIYLLFIIRDHISKIIKEPKK